MARLSSKPHGKREMLSKVGSMECGIGAVRFRSLGTSHAKKSLLPRLPKISLSSYREIRPTDMEP